MAGSRQHGSVEARIMIYICSLAHGSGEPPKELITDDPILADRFAEAEDGRPGRGIYQALNPLIPGAQRRCLETVAAIQFIYFDLDIQNIDATREQILDWLRQLPIEFVWVRDSGSGNIHAGIEIKDAPPPGPEYDRVVAVWKRLAEKFAADPAPVHPAALIRRVGTHNKKNGSNGLCHELWNGGRPVDITELEALDELLVEPLLTRKQVEQSGVTNVPPETRPPVDVDERLSRMQWRGPGDSSIHSTQLSVSAAMLRQGISLNEMVQVVLSATRGVGDPSWNWGEEERTIRRMGIDLINKDPEGLADRLPEDLRQKVIDILANGRRPKITYTLNLGWHVRAEREGTKTSIVRDLLIKGTTIQEILEATGWPTVSVPQMARNAGLQLTKWTEGDTT
jgi:hypothetical protein